MPQPDASEHIAMGRKLARMGRFEQAAAEYNKAIEIDPKNYEALMNLGYVYYEIGFDEEARQAFTRAEALRPLPEK
jgi:Flp pilus assembly protein TadD